MATCHLCPPDERHIADDEVAVHARREHGEAVETWPDGARIVLLDDSVMWEDWSR